MKLFFQLSIAFFLGISANSYAFLNHSYYSESLNEETALTTLRAQLNQIDGVDFTIGNMMLNWMDLSEKENHLCEQYSKSTQAQLHLMCVRHDLQLVTAKAFDLKRIDEVELSNLNLLLRKLTLKKGELTFLTMKPNLWGRLFNKKKKRVSIPQLGTYETNSNHLKKLRVLNGRPAELDPVVLGLLKKTYFRRILGLGKVTPDQYILSKYSVSQIKLMSNMIMETMSWTDEQVTAELIIDRVGLKKKQAHLTELQNDFAQSASRGEFSPDALKQKTDEISNLKKEIEATNTQKQMEDLNDKRYELAVKLTTIPIDDEHEAARGELNTQLLDLSDQIDELETKLEGEVIVVPIDGENLHRMAMNHLDNLIQTAQRGQGALTGFDGNIANLLVCAYLTGDVDGEVLKALLSYQDYKELHESFLLKAGRLVWTAGKMYLMINPYTVIPTTLISVVVGALQKKKQYEKEMSEKTFLIRQ